MHSSTKSLLLFFIVATLQPTNPITLDAVLDIVKISKDIVIWIGKAWNLVETEVGFQDIPLPLLDKTERLLFAKIDGITTTLNTISQQVDAIGTTTISFMLQNLPERIRLELRLNDLLSYYISIDVHYNAMQKYISRRDEIEKITLLDFAHNVVSHDTHSVRYIVEQIYAFIVPNGKGISNTGILGLLNKNLQVGPKFNYKFNWGEDR